MDYYASYKNSKTSSLLRKELISCAMLQQQKSCTALPNCRKNSKEMEKTMGGKKGAGLKDLSKNLKKSLHNQTVLAIQNQKHRRKSGNR